MTPRKLHIGHWVGSLENRVRLQDSYECYFLIANLHAFTTRAAARETLGGVREAMKLRFARGSFKDPTGSPRRAE